MNKKIATALTVTTIMLSSANAFAAPRSNSKSQCGTISLSNLCSNYLSGKTNCTQSFNLCSWLGCDFSGNFDYIFTNDNGSSDCTDGNCTAEAPDTEQNSSSQNSETENPSESNTTTTTATGTTGTTESEYIAEVVRLVNEERAKEGLSALKTDSSVQAAAQVRAVETATLFSHTRPNGTSCFTALQEAGVTYSSAGENIAYGQQTPEAVVSAWMNSSGHRANILNSSYTTIGVGCYKSGNTYYWSQFFIS